MKMIFSFFNPNILTGSGSDRGSSYISDKTLWNTVFYIAILILFSRCSGNEAPQYTVVSSPWQEKLGNHRAMIEVESPAEAVYLEVPWRRHDPSPEDKKFIIIHEASGDTIENIHRLHVDNEKCELVFGPADRAGTYFFYYLPFKPDPRNGFFRYGYLPSEPSPDEGWIQKNNLNDTSITSSLEIAQCVEFQSRTAFDSFFPMEIIPTSEEKSGFLSRYPGEYHIFPESREYPIRMRDEIPLKWIRKGPEAAFEGKALRNEYYTFQLGLYAVKKDIKNVAFKFNDLRNGNNILPASSFTCFNTEGVDPYGEPFIIRSDVEKGKVQAYWIGLDINESLSPGTYSGSLIIDPENADKYEVILRINIGSEILADRGDSEPWRHSRLRWLNSSLGIDNKPVPPFRPVQYDGKSLFEMKLKKVMLAENGLPSSIRSGDTEILNRPVSFVLRTDNGELDPDSTNFNIIDESEGKVQTRWVSYLPEVKMTNIVSVEADGHLNFRISIEALKSISCKDLYLEIPFKQKIGEYMMGMGLPGSETPRYHQNSWEGPHDSFWVGNSRGGLHCELRGSDYHGPLLSIYQTEYPESWYNNDLGSFRISRKTGEVIASVHSGERDMKAGDEIKFEFSLLITPVKEIDIRSHFEDRYYHSYPDPESGEDIVDLGIKIINLHHANKYNPYINYPFIATEEMKGFVDRWQEKGIKVKIYYTIRELSNHVYELWALRSLGHEILLGPENTYPWMVSSGIDKGYPWLIEHLEGDYATAWYSRLNDGAIDASILSTPESSRWYNYYIEGLAWLVKNIDIDGLYLDDVAYDRRMVKRIRKVMEQEKPGCIIDLHSHRGFSGGPAIQYAEFFPYIDKLWFGEAFEYDKMSPANWLVETSGIPFGLMGNMLEGGGNPWLGMVFGMTSRIPWVTEGETSDPRPVWEVWDDFGISEARMTGFWEKNNPVRTSSSEVKATTYIRENKVLVSLGSWADGPVNVELIIDWEQLGLDKNKVRMKAPFIRKFQPERLFTWDQKIPVEPLKGWLIILEESE